MDQAKYQQLKELLMANKKWPMLYMFKFIVPNTDNKVNIVSGMMPDGAEVTYKHTKNLKFVSVTCKALMPSADSIIELTHKVGSISGVICL